MQTLQSIGTSAALELPAGQKGPQNREALVWQLIDPDGNTHKAVVYLVRLDGFFRKRVVLPPAHQCRDDRDNTGRKLLTGGYFIQ